MSPQVNGDSQMNQQTLEIKSSAITDKGLSDKRPQNEDSYLELPESGMYAVADGVGGAFGGDVASQMAVETLSEAFVNLREGGDVEERMRAAITQANAAIFQMSQDLPQLSTMATTLVALQINGNIATIGHVGDSRLYRLDPAGALFQETQDHSLVEEQVRAGKMTRAQAAVHPSRNVISRALGAEVSVEIDMKTIMFDPGSVFLVCSDGITKHIDDDELKDLLATIKDPAELCAEFKKRCYERGAEDNLTAVVVSIASGTDSDDLLQLDEEVETIATPRVDATVQAPGLASLSNEPAVVDLDEDVDTLDLSEEFPEATKSKGIAATAENSQEKKGAESVESVDVVVDSEAGLDSSDSIGSPEESDLPNSSVDQHAWEAGDEDEEPEIEIPLVGEKVADAEVIKADSAITSSTLSTQNEVKSYRVSEGNSASGFLAKAVSALLWTLVGVLIGLICFYVYSNLFGSRSPGVQNANLAVYEFEQKRRLVDADPAKYLSAYGTTDVVTAADHYLVGRAYLLQGNFGAAKTSFENARKALASEKPINRKVLDRDISVGAFIANNEEAQKALSKEIAVEEGDEESSDKDQNDNGRSDDESNSASREKEPEPKG